MEEECGTLMGQQSTSKQQNAGPSDLAGRQDRLNYMADMLKEMQELASREGCPTLAGLLALSHAEAERQARLGH